MPCLGSGLAWMDVSGRAETLPSVVLGSLLSLISDMVRSRYSQQEVACLHCTMRGTFCVETPDSHYISETEWMNPTLRMQ